jgi:hypothetical protein
VCVQVPCVYLLYAASTVTMRNNYGAIESGANTMIHDSGDTYDNTSHSRYSRAEIS